MTDIWNVMAKFLMIENAKWEIRCVFLMYKQWMIRLQ